MTHNTFHVSEAQARALQDTGRFYAFAEAGWYRWMDDQGDPGESDGPHGTRKEAEAVMWPSLVVDD